MVNVQVLHHGKNNAVMPPVLTQPAKSPYCTTETPSFRYAREAVLCHLLISRALSLGSDTFPAWTQILDPKAGFLVNGCITVSATVLVLEESMQFTRDTDSSAAAGEESLR